jgi:hypothetical protein
MNSFEVDFRDLQRQHLVLNLRINGAKLQTFPPTESVAPQIHRLPLNEWGYNPRLCWQCPVCQILVRDGETADIGLQGTIFLALTIGTNFLEN